MKLYALIVDGGDGSAGLHWFSDEAEMQNALDTDGDEYDFVYFMNEGSPAVTINVPEGMTPEDLGIRV